MANSRHYILDSGLNPVPVNAIGELYVAGINLARGYLDQPGLSAERFVADPFVPDGSRMYARAMSSALPNGTLEFRGRMDAQVKIRGFRIELAKSKRSPRLDGVEHALSRHEEPGRLRHSGYVRCCADGAGGHGRLYIELDTAELRQLARVSSRTTCSRRVQQIPAIPLTATASWTRARSPRGDGNASPPRTNGNGS